MPQWIDENGATLNAMAEHGLLWVVEKIPTGLPKMAIWELAAREGDRVADLITRWLEAMHIPVPQSHSARESELMKSLQYQRDVVLVIENADLLRGNVLNGLRLLTEKSVLLVLVGDVAQIYVSTKSVPSFYQRAIYCVPVTKLF